MAASETDTLYRYRVRCTSESAYVYTWAKETPTACPNDPAHTIQQDMITVVDSVSKTTQVVANLPNTPNDELRVSARVQTMALRSCYGINLKHDYVAVTGSGTVTNAFPGGDGTYTLKIASANSSATLRSTARFQAVSAFQAEAAVTGAVPPLSGSCVAVMGAHDGSDGVYFKFTAAGAHVAFLRDGVETLVPQAEWNADAMDGTGVSGLALDASAGIVGTFKVLYACQGFGPVRYAICTVHPDTHVEHTWTVHVHVPEATGALRTPNLPLVASLACGGAAGGADTTLLVRDRAFCSHGEAYPNFRRHIVWGKSMKNINSTSAYRHLFSIRHRAGFQSVPVIITETTFASNEFLVLQLRIGASLDKDAPGDWKVDPETTSAVETNEVAEDMSGGIVVWSGMVHDETKLFGKLDIGFDLPDMYAVTLCGIGMDSKSPRPSGGMSWKEFW